MSKFVIFYPISEKTFNEQYTCSLGEEIDPVSEALHGEDFSSVSGQQHALFEEIYWINSGKGIQKKTRGSTCWCCKELQQQLHEANDYMSGN